jgi:hypothetical protein
MQKRRGGKKKGVRKVTEREVKKREDESCGGDRMFKEVWGVWEVWGKFGALWLVGERKCSFSASIPTIQLSPASSSREVFTGMKSNRL